MFNLTLDTVGTPGGQYIWPILLTGTAGGNTNFGDVPVDITNGSIAIVPEPASFAMGFCALIALGAILAGKRFRR